MDRSGSGTASLRAINDDSYEQPDEPVDQVDHRADW
jgi:hypothetical protein